MAAAALVLIASPAMAEGNPIPRDGGRACPYGYTGSGSYCVPVSDRSDRAVPKREGDTCPHGFSASGSGCLSMR